MQARMASDINKTIHFLIKHAKNQCKNQQLRKFTGAEAKQEQLSSMQALTELENNLKQLKKRIVDVADLLDLESLQAYKAALDDIKSAVLANDAVKIQLSIDKLNDIAIAMAVKHPYFDKIMGSLGGALFCSLTTGVLLGIPVALATASVTIMGPMMLCSMSQKVMGEDGASNIIGQQLAINYFTGFFAAFSSIGFFLGGGIGYNISDEHIEMHNKVVTLTQDSFKSDNVHRFFHTKQKPQQIEDKPESLLSTKGSKIA